MRDREDEIRAGRFADSSGRDRRLQDEPDFVVAAPVARALGAALLEEERARCDEMFSGRYTSLSRELLRL